MKARTAKRLAILIAVLSLVGGTGFFTQRYQVNRLARRNSKRPNLQSRKVILPRPRCYSENTLESFLTIRKHRLSMLMYF